jgi:hypothetical protein
MQKFFLILLFTGLLFSACKFSPDPSNGVESTTLSQDTASAEEVVIAVELKEHQVRLAQSKSTKGTLPKLGADKLEAWWDSLPNQIQEKIKEQQVDIEVVTTLSLTKDSMLVSDQHLIEKTGDILEEIIGDKTNLTYTLSTKEDVEKEPKLEGSTVIKLREHVAVKLNSFDVQVFFRDKVVSNENRLTIQYWWLNLPVEIKEQIRNRELLVQLDAIVVEQFLDGGGSQQDIPVEDNLDVFTHSINKIIGIQPFINVAVPLASLRTKIIYRKMDEKTLLYPAAQSVNISLHKNQRIYQAPF